MRGDAVLKVHQEGGPKPGARIKGITREWFEAEAEFWKKTLGLDEWDVTLVIRPRTRLEGECKAHSGHFTCKIMLRQDPLAGEARYNVAHEFLHLAMRPWDQADEKVVNEHIGSSAQDAALATMVDGTEAAIERLAHALVRLTPDRTEPS
jgi:hypothetical protein